VHKSQCQNTRIWKKQGNTTPPKRNKTTVTNANDSEVDGRQAYQNNKFLNKTLKARREWNNVFHTLKENNCQPRLLIPNKALLHN
jgi:hypothetical protein